MGDHGFRIPQSPLTPSRKKLVTFVLRSSTSGSEESDTSKTDGNTKRASSVEPMSIDNISRFGFFILNLKNLFFIVLQKGNQWILMMLQVQNDQKVHHQVRLKKLKIPGIKKIFIFHKFSLLTYAFSPELHRDDSNNIIDLEEVPSQGIFLALKK